ncbi:MAG: thioredoxin [Planctomycetota bacterium]|nr:thioredoxin [Planctomycetota bacterium]
MSQEFTDANFEEEVIRSEQPVLVDFGAEWCAPCKQLSPIIDELAKEYSGRVKVGKVDIEQSQQTAAKLGITSVPTVVLFKGGERIESLTGLNTKEFFKEKLDELL